MLKRFQVFVQIVGCVTMGLLAVYGLLTLLRIAPVWAAGGQTSAVPARAEAPQVAIAAGTVPGAMNFQGYLRDSEGNLMSGYYTMTFTIYDDAVVGTSLWFEQQISVTVRDGYFNVLLGDDPENLFPDDLFTSPDRYIGVTVDPYAEMVPRQRFASVPYAFHADRANGLSAADNDPVDAVTVNDTGQVGIGTTDPLYKLHVAGSAYVTNRAYVDGRVGIGTTSPSYKLHVAGGSAYVTNNAYVDGNVGIGTTSPSYKLHVDGSAYVTNNAYVDGNVGIGTTSPSEKLDVDGNIAASGSIEATGVVATGGITTSGNIAWDTSTGHLTGMVVTTGYDAASSGLPGYDYMVSITNSVCFLTMVQFAEIDDGSESAACVVDQYNGQWRLAAYAPGTDATAYCEAVCLQW